MRGGRGGGNDGSLKGENGGGGRGKKIEEVVRRRTGQEGWRRGVNGEVKAGWGEEGGEPGYTDCRLTVPDGEGPERVDAVGGEGEREEKE